ncbi:MAG TPA: hypothetical protein EYP49_01355 [Anaerolineae bacterium]|nr:hypothetical protein [Anaerolineae bacterium]
MPGHLPWLVVQIDVPQAIGRRIGNGRPTPVVPDLEIHTRGWRPVGIEDVAPHLGYIAIRLVAHVDDVINRRRRGRCRCGSRRWRRVRCWRWRVRCCERWQGRRGRCRGRRRKRCRWGCQRRSGRRGGRGNNRDCCNDPCWQGGMQALPSHPSRRLS